MPKSRLDFWETKLKANKERDRRQRRELGKLGWRVLTIWECQLRSSKIDMTKRRIGEFLGS